MIQKIKRDEIPECVKVICGYMEKKIEYKRVDV